MVGEVEEKKLYDAVLTGDATIFQQLLQQDPHLLHRVSFVYCPNTITPLHIATLQGNLDIIEEVLKRNPQLAKLLDSKKSSHLQISAAEGYVEIASMLLLAAPKMCWQCDCHGMNLIHVAAVNGNVENILRNLIRKEPFAVREKVDGRQTVFHLCVKHDQLMALVLLVESLGDHLVSAEDDEGDTVLHLAVRCNQIEMIRYLVNSKKIERSKVNSNEKTLDILQEIPSERTTSRIEELDPISVHMVVQSIISIPRQVYGDWDTDCGPNCHHDIPSRRQLPRGVWQDDSSTHTAGATVIAYNHPKIYKHFVRANTVAFASSLIIIFLLTTRLLSLHVVVTLAVKHTMWVSLGSIAVSYGASVMVITPVGLRLRELPSFYLPNNS